MNITSISFSYFFLIIALISISFFLYFRLLTIKTSSNNSSREKIIGAMKDPIGWREKNVKMSYTSMFWAVISLVAFIYLKFFYTPNLIPITYLFIYLALIAISSVAFSRTKEKKYEK